MCSGAAEVAAKLRAAIAVLSDVRLSNRSHTGRERER